MRIGLVCPYSLSLPGGVQGQVLGLAHALRSRGHVEQVCLLFLLRYAEAKQLAVAQLRWGKAPCQSRQLPKLSMLRKTTTVLRIAATKMQICQTALRSCRHVEQVCLLFLRRYVEAKQLASVLFRR